MYNFTIENAAPEQDKQGSGTITMAQDFDVIDQSSADTNDTVYYNEIPLEIKDIAKEYIEWGLCAIPPRQGEKRPIGTWREYQERFPTDDEWEQWSNADGVCQTFPGICWLPPVDFGLCPDGNRIWQG